MLRKLALHLLLGAVAFLSGTSASSAQSNDGWVLKNDKDAVKVYIRRTADVHEIKLVTSLKAPLSGLVQLLSEVDQYPAWGYKVAESRLVRRVNDHECYYYSKLDFPWPINDRDVIMHSTLQQDPVTKAITAASEAAPDMLPETKDVVRIRKCNTRWTMIPGAGGWVYVEYYIYSNPGGNLPDWLVNMAVDSGPRETIKNMRQILQQPKYQNAKLAYIKD
ncbi:MAG TPA: START domain-containing protein [Saprospiraceae bacterium]|nr:START domain-containing protein [Saprospiraceae bacterium]